MEYDSLRLLNPGFVILRGQEFGAFCLNEPFKTRPVAPLAWLRQALWYWFLEMGWSSTWAWEQEMRAAGLHVRGTLSRQTLKKWMAGTEPGVELFDAFLRDAEVLTRARRPIVRFLRKANCPPHIREVRCIECAKLEDDCFDAYGHGSVWDPFGRYLELVAAWAVVSLAENSRLLMPFHEEDLSALLSRIGADGSSIVEVLQALHLVAGCYFRHPLRGYCRVWGVAGQPGVDPPGLEGEPILGDDASAELWAHVLTERVRLGSFSLADRLMYSNYLLGIPEA